MDSDGQCTHQYDMATFVGKPREEMKELGAVMMTAAPSHSAEVKEAIQVMHDAIRRLDGFYCPFPECWPGGVQEAFTKLQYLCTHLRVDHNNASYCNVCLEYRPVFLREQKVYTAAELSKHFKGQLEEKDDGFTGHPRCLFCNRMLYDADSLLKHMNQTQHVTCDFCNIGEFKFTYYRDHESLYRHYEACHRICKHRDCAHKIVVDRSFLGEIELQAHNAKEHGGSTKIGLQHLGFNFSSGPTNGRAAPASVPNGAAPATGANVQASKITFDFVTHRAEEDLAHYKAGAHQVALADRDRVQVSKDKEDQQRNDVLLQEILTSLLTAKQLQEFKATSVAYLQGKLFATQYFKAFQSVVRDKSNQDLIFEPLVKSLPDEVKRDALVKAKLMLTCDEETRRLAAMEDHSHKKGKKPSSPTSPDVPPPTRSQNLRSLHRAMHESNMRPKTIKDRKGGAISYAAAAGSVTPTSPSTFPASAAPKEQTVARPGWTAQAAPPPPPPPTGYPGPPPTTFADPNMFPALESTSRRRPNKPTKAPEEKPAWGPNAKK